jgi:hypothetical protein
MGNRAGQRCSTAANILSLRKAFCQSTCMVTQAGAGAESVPDNLAAPANANGDLQWGQGVAGFKIRGQGAEGGGLYQTLLTAMGWMPPDGLGKGRRRRRGGGVKEAGKVATDHCLDNSEHGSAGLFAAAGGGLMCSYVQPMGPAAGP